MFPKPNLKKRIVEALLEHFPLIAGLTSTAIVWWLYEIIGGQWRMWNPFYLGLFVFILLFPTLVDRLDSDLLGFIVSLAIALFALGLSIATRDIWWVNPAIFAMMTGWIVKYALDDTELWMDEDFIWAVFTAFGVGLFIFIATLSFWAMGMAFLIAMSVLYRAKTPEIAIIQPLPSGAT